MSNILNLNIDDLPTEGLKEAAKAIGLPAVKTLMVKCPGAKLYIPKTLNSSYNKKFVKDHFTGDNHEWIADRLGVTVRTIYRLARD